MLGVNKGRYAAFLLALGNGVDGQGGLTGTLGTVNLDDTAARETADAQRHVEADAAGRNDVKLFIGAVAKFHNGSFTVTLLNLVQRALQYFQFFLLQGIGFVHFFCHNVQVFRIIFLLFWISANLHKKPELHTGA